MPGKNENFEKKSLALLMIFPREITGNMRPVLSLSSACL
jgi:hypothetical protein